MLAVWSPGHPAEVDAAARARPVAGQRITDQDPRSSRPLQARPIRVSQERTAAGSDRRSPAATMVTHPRALRVPRHMTAAYGERVIELGGRLLDVYV